MNRLISDGVDYVRANSAKLIKFVLVTGASVIVGQALLAFLLYIVEMESYVRANIIAVVVMTIPNYLVNRYWVWGKRSKNSFKREVLPFWVLAAIGFGFSTFAVWMVSRADAPRLAVLVANFVAYGIVWVFKFFVLERFLFSADDAADSATEHAAVA